MSSIPLLVLVSAASVTLGSAQAAQQVQPGEPAQRATPADVSGEFRTAADLLAALETADRDLRSLQSNISYTREFGSIEGNVRQEWSGTLYYDADLGRGAGDGGAPPRRGFAVVFDSSILDGQKRQERRDFVFDGQWFVERLHAERQMIRRRVVPPGEVADPLKIGEGPFPIPIGQKREEILGRFEVTLLPPGDGWPGGEAPRVLNGSWQLRLVPREGTQEAREFREVRLWYQRMKTPGDTAGPAEGRLLPRMARTINMDGGAVEVFLTDLRPNQPVPDGVFDTAPPPRGSGWDVTTQEFRGGFDQTTGDGARGRRNEGR